MQRMERAGSGSQLVAKRRGRWLLAAVITLAVLAMAGCMTALSQAGPPSQSQTMPIVRPAP